MKWNANDLKDKLSFLKTQYNNCNNEATKKFLELELKEVELMLDYATLEKVNESNYRINLCLSEDTILKKKAFYEEFIAKFCYKLNFLEYSRRLPQYNLAKNNIKKDEYLKLVVEFLKNYDQELLKLFYEMNSDSRINLSDKTYYISTCLGITAYLPTFNVSYIDAIFKNKIMYSSCLPHELAHAYQFKNISRKEDHEMIYSALREAYSIFVELVYFDYLKQTKYYRSAMNCERSFIDSLALVLEFNYKNFLKTSNITINNSILYDNGGEVINQADASKFLAKILAYHFINIYRNNGNIKEELNNFHKSFKNGNEYEYFEKIGVNELVSSLKEEFSNYYRDFGNGKKKIFR